ncbi:uncharacterized protein L3040_006874 [Drepanopeziza brunnea f. sp. 'multigermtubi']|uniref:2EXR domain-containing protein n=1 Tax=Marssonina brunnea f. sp. multigermtubi (strain MB_m1) TaxID=1072389 RepID=K1WVN0_MARBU|nr:uncharacterized protein MBM_08952 [Drepanopeziza brunnea f. sp. 'multigermtubi' MB_m1]EKD12723.1 hypothetical protein MBM_08952 [Drepanopeziza brunnea f. sp. 'multigermtubi' MB_m1]KAJ5038000.1 hypothetical protein L3040_006874 [Drepanopeziza brunnea f. sp. 'multigermtubi']
MGRSRSKSANKDVSAREEPEFTVFKNLPLELRILIWKESIPEPNIVRINYKYHLRIPDAKPDDFTVCYEIPAILHTNQEARRAAESVYDKAFPKNLGRYVYFDWSRDVLVFRTEIAASRFFGFEMVQPIHMNWTTPPAFKLSAPVEKKLTLLGFERDCYRYHSNALVPYMMPRELEHMGSPSHIVFLREYGCPLQKDSITIRRMKRDWEHNRDQPDSPHAESTYEYPDVSSLNWEQLRQKLNELHKPSTLVASEQPSQSEKTMPEIKPHSAALVVSK